VAQGPRFFRDHLDLADVRAQIAAWQPAEKMQPLDPAAPLPRRRGPRLGPESGGRRLLRLLTLQGFLLPRALLLDRVLVLDKDFHGSPSSVFRFRRVLYQHRASGTGYIAEYDRRLFFAELAAGVHALAALLRQRAALRAAHAQGMEQMATPAFWREVYGLPSPPAQGAPANDAVIEQPASAA
jgi:hypothetical protein